MVSFMMNFMMSGIVVSSLVASVRL